MYKALILVVKYLYIYNIIYSIGQLDISIPFSPAFRVPPLLVCLPPCSAPSRVPVFHPSRVPPAFRPFSRAFRVHPSASRPILVCLPHPTPSHVLFTPALSRQHIMLRWSSLRPHGKDATCRWKSAKKVRENRMQLTQSSARRGACGLPMRVAHRGARGLPVRVARGARVGCLGV
jgi:hypothetical protein